MTFSMVLPLSVIMVYNFYFKVWHKSLFIIGHISTIDTFSNTLCALSKIREDGTLSKMIKTLWIIWKKLEEGFLSLENCEKYVKENGKPKHQSEQQELYEMILNRSI